MRHHRPKPRPLKRGEMRRRVARANGFIGWYRIGDRLVHGDTLLVDVIRYFMGRGIELKIEVVPRK